MAHDPYETLGTSRAASQDEIRKAFHALVEKHHPDLNPGDAKTEELFKSASAVNEIPSDPEKRAHSVRVSEGKGRGFRSSRSHAGDLCDIETLGEPLIHAHPMSAFGTEPNVSFWRRAAEGHWTRPDPLRNSFASAFRTAKERSRARA